MKSLIALVCLLACLAVHAQQELTPEQKQHFQEQADAINRATEAIKGLEDITNAIVRNVTKACVVTGVNQTQCACLANNIPLGIAEDTELWGKGATRTAWVAYVTIVTVPLPESEIVSKLKTADAKRMVQNAFKARYKCSP